MTIVAWPLGLAASTVKTTSTVYHHYVWIAHKGTNCGPMIPHVSIDAGFDTIMVLHMINSSRKGKFGAGEVKANGTAIGCLTPIDIGVVPTPMLLCGAIPAPVSGTGTAVLLNSVIVGMHLADLVMGWIDVLGSMIVSFIKGLSFGAADWNAPDPNSAGSWGLLNVSFMPNIPGFAAAIVGLLFQEYGDYHGDVAWSYKPISGHLAGLGVTMERSGETGDRTLTAGGRGGPQAANAHGQGQWTWSGDDGDLEQTSSGGVGSFGAGADLRDDDTETSGWSSPAAEGMGEAAWDLLPSL